MAGMYGVYHGPKRLKKIAKQIHALATKLSEGLHQLGYLQVNNKYFDTIQVRIEDVNMDTLKVFAEDAKLTFITSISTLSISIDEKDDIQNINDILQVFAKSCNHADPDGLITEVLSGDYMNADSYIPDGLYRTTGFMQHEVFNSYHSETAMMRYIKSLENKTFRSIIP